MATSNNKRIQTTIDKANNDDSVVVNARTVRQNKRARNKSSRAAELEMNKVEKYRDKSVIDEAVNKSNVYDKSVQDRADTKNWSDRKRARVENKKGIELGDQEVMYTEDTWQRANEQKRLGSLPGHTTTTDIDKDRFKNTYTLSGKYKGTREKPIGGIGDKPKGRVPKPNDKDFHKSISKEFSAATSWDMGGKYGYKRKHKAAQIKKWKEEGRDVSKKDLLTKRGQRKLRTEFIKDKIPGAKKVINKLHREYYANTHKTDSTHSKTQEHNYDTTNKKHIYKGTKEKNK